jgi:two-component system OmpR family response regulator
MNPPIHDDTSGSDSFEGAPSVFGRVLLVEDDTIIQGLIAMSLRKAGYQVKCAEDGEAGWEILSSGHFDLLITDNNLPNLTGVELIRRLRATDQHVPVMLISGQVPWSTPGLETLLSPGMAMEKPFSMARLLEAVHGVMHPVSVRAGSH